MADHYGHKERLQDSVKIFRSRANLHDNSKVPALVKWAHHEGKARPYAEEVREAWRDFEMDRKYAGLPVERYVLDYGSAPDAPPPGEPSGLMDDGVEGVDYTVDRDTGEVHYTGEPEPEHVPIETIAPDALNEPKSKTRKEAHDSTKPIPASAEKGSVVPEAAETGTRRRGAATATDAFDDEEVLF